MFEETTMTQRHLRLVPPASRFADLDPETLTSAEGDALIALALRVLAQRHRRGAALTSPSDTQAYLRLWLAGRPQEVFACLFLDTKHRVIACEELFQGTIDGASVHPREVVRRTLQWNAGAVIFAHNHPSGVAEPSQADLRITQKLKDALALLEVRVLDHVVVAAEGSVSLAERGLL
jgi:DNA repair protein RadC